MGGHFGVDAARFALEQLAHAEQGQLPGTIEVCLQHGPQAASEYFHVPLRLHFASHIAGAAMLKATKTKDIWMELDAIVGKLWVESHRHAYQAMVVIVDQRLWPRFG